MNRLSPKQLNKLATDGSMMNTRPVYSQSPTHFRQLTLLECIEVTSRGKDGKSIMCSGKQELGSKGTQRSNDIDNIKREKKSKKSNVKYVHKKHQVLMDGGSSIVVKAAKSGPKESSDSSCADKQSKRDLSDNGCVGAPDVSVIVKSVKSSRRKMTVKFKKSGHKESVEEIASSCSEKQKDRDLNGSGDVGATDIVKSGHKESAEEVASSCAEKQNEKDENDSFISGGVGATDIGSPECKDPPQIHETESTGKIVIKRKRALKSSHRKRKIFKPDPDCEKTSIIPPSKANQRDCTDKTEHSNRSDYTDGTDNQENNKVHLEDVAHSNILDSSRVANSENLNEGEKRVMEVVSEELDEDATMEAEYPVASTPQQKESRRLAREKQLRDMKSRETAESRLERAMRRRGVKIAGKKSSTAESTKRVSWREEVDLVSVFSYSPCIEDSASPT